MRQAKICALVALVLTYSYGIADVDRADIDYSSPQYNNSEQQDNAASSEKEDDSVDNTLKDYGPITICADKAVYNDQKKTLTYYDNVVVMQIHNKHILCKKPKKLKDSTVYFSRDDKLPFKKLQDEWLKSAKSWCTDQKECNFISGQKLTLNLDKDNKVDTLIMSSAGDELSQFYNYPVDANPDFKTSKEVTNGPAEGVAKQIIYDVVNKNLKLNKDSVVTQNGNKYKGQKVDYDLDHGLISIPGSRHKRSTIVLDGVADQTKIDTGLTPIKDYHKNDNMSSGSGIMLEDDMTSGNLGNSQTPQNEIM